LKKIEKALSHAGERCPCSSVQLEKVRKSWKSECVHARAGARAGERGCARAPAQVCIEEKFKQRARVCGVPENVYARVPTGKLIFTT
jgi:hypothetical protein